MHFNIVLMHPPSHRESLTPYRREAQSYYGSAEYMRQVAVLREIIGSVSDRLARVTVAVDLEGTLTCLDLLEHFYGGRFGSVDRLRRPFSNEMLAALSETSPSHMIWSSAPPDRFTQVIRSSRLRIPERMIRAHRWDYVSQIEASKTDLLDRLTIVFSDSDQRTRTWDKLVHRGVPKIPLVMGVDFLLDDRAQEDRRLLNGIYPLQSAKILDVQPFTFESRKQLAHHYRDTGLLDACERLAERVRADALS